MLDYTLPPTNTSEADLVQWIVDVATGSRVYRTHSPLTPFEVLSQAILDGDASKLAKALHSLFKTRYRSLPRAARLAVLQASHCMAYYPASDGIRHLVSQDLAAIAVQSKHLEEVDTTCEAMLSLTSMNSTRPSTFWTNLHFANNSQSTKAVFSGMAATHPEPAFRWLGSILTDDFSIELSKWLPDVFPDLVDKYGYQLLRHCRVYVFNTSCASHRCRDVMSQVFSLEYSHAPNQSMQQDFNEVVRILCDLIRSMPPSSPFLRISYSVQRERQVAQALSADRMLSHLESQMAIIPHDDYMLLDLVKCKWLQCRGSSSELLQAALDAADNLELQDRNDSPPPEGEQLPNLQPAERS